MAAIPVNARSANLGSTTSASLDTICPRSRSALGLGGRIAAVAALGLVVANCSSAPQRQARGGGVDPKYGVAASPKMVADGEEVPKGGGRQMVGKPYVVAGRLYTPRENPNYSATGTASWYGPSFHGRMTANGEVFDKMSISAAHPTMPLPSYVRVTNVGNGSSIIARVNDRGPYHGGRLIDVSQRVAEALNFRHMGTARVQVDYIGRASTAGSDDAKLYATLRTDGGPAQLRGGSTMVASAAPISEPVRAVSRPVEEAPAESLPAATAPASASAVAVTPVALSAGKPAPGTPLPPDRPFDLGTIPNAFRPVPAPLPRSATRTGGQQVGLFYADAAAASPGFRKADPIGQLLTTQSFVPLKQP
jgi:rare lipoprotein A